MSTGPTGSPTSLLIDPPWDTILATTLHDGKPIAKAGIAIRCYFVFSLIVHLHLSLVKFLLFLFESDNEIVRHRAAIFMGHRATDAYGPSQLYHLWHDRYPSSRPHLHASIVAQCAQEMVQEESDNFIKDPKYKVLPRSCTVDHIMDTLDPGRLVDEYQESVPFTWSMLSTFATSPNAHRRRTAKKRDAAAVDPSDDATSPTDDTNAEAEDEFELDYAPPPPVLEANRGSEWFSKGFIRNPTFALVFVISIMTFVRNSSSNLFPLIMGLFLEIGGTSARVISTLSNAGVCVSITTIERLKRFLSIDAKTKAVMLMKSVTPSLSIFDNINIYLRKSQQRLFNKNSMIHATNAAVISLPGIDPSALDLKTKLANRGKRKDARAQDIIPTGEDDEKMYGSYVGLVMRFIITYCPGSDKWKERSNMLKAADALMASDRPLPPRKTDARPLGVYDVNEGSKKGIVQMLEELQKSSTLSREEWSGQTRIVGGDWLTAANFRSARKERTNDVDSMERLEYVEDITQLFHFALNACHMLIKLHFGNAQLDPGSLAKHKGLLNRTWDAAKPNYADAKALIRHSLVARILYSVMLHCDFFQYSQLEMWKPTVEDLQNFAEDFVETYTSTDHAEKAKAAQDDYLAHSVYFIRDALTFCEFEHAVSFADAGRILRVLKYWSLSFRGAGLHNYARECLEILLRWKYELAPELKRAMEQSWFVNRWGLPGRWNAADLYIEQLNYWVKRVFIAKGSGLTVEYIINKGSACIEVFREISHKFSRTFGHADRARRHKEVNIDHDIRLLCEEMYNERLHILTDDRPILGQPKLDKKGNITKEAESIIYDCYDTGMSMLNNNKFEDFIVSTLYEEGLYAVSEDYFSNSQDSTNPIVFGNFADIDDGDDIPQRCVGSNGLGGGLEL